jgi:C_GCAxxG_C_C family probable redox protein
MALRNTVEQYYFNNYNCAESVFLAANEQFGLGLDPASSKLVGGYGGGVQTGSACGAFLAAVSVLSVMCIGDRAHNSKVLRPVVNDISDGLTEKLGSTLCREIRPTVFEPERRCMVTVAAVCDLLEEAVERYGLQKTEDKETPEEEG